MGRATGHLHWQLKAWLRLIPPNTDWMVATMVLSGNQLLEKEHQGNQQQDHNIKSYADQEDAPPPGEG